jgi:hypothetical protein
MPAPTPSTVTENVTPDAFDVAVKKLLRAMQDVHEATTQTCPMNFNRAEPYWVICLGKFHAAYLKANHPDGFRPMFRKFYDTHRENIKAQIIEDDQVYDDWIKTKVVVHNSIKSTSKSGKNHRSRKHTEDSSSWNPHVSCKGLVIYFDPNNDKLRAVSIPLSEAYLQACKYYAELSKDKGVCSPLPATILYSFYAAMSQVCDPQDLEALTANVESLKDVVDSLTPESTGTEGSTLEPLKDMMKALAKNSGIPGMNQGDDSQINSALGTLFSAETSDKISNVVRSVTEQISTKSGDNVGDVVSQIGQLLQNPTLTDMVKDTVESAQRLQDSIPTQQNVSGTPVGVPTASSGPDSAADQE